MRAYNKPMRIEKITLEQPRADEVLVRLVATGVCHTDLSMHKGLAGTPMPSVLGHEGTGIVERVGASVRKVKPGDHVVLSFLYCGHCKCCLGGEPAYCLDQRALNFGCVREDGTSAGRNAEGPVLTHFFGQSSFATHTVANEKNIVKVPRNAPLELLGPLGCGLQTGAGAVMNALKVSVGASFVCFGAGSVGLAAIMAARVVGATTIIAVDLVEERLKLARKLGATHVVNGNTTDVVAAILKITAGAGVDFAFDTTGLAGPFNQGLAVLAMRGVIGYVTGGPSPMRQFDARQLMLRGARIVSVIEGDAVPELFIPYLLKLYMQGRFPFDKMVKFYPLKQINRAFADSARGRTVKPILRME